MDTVYNHLLKYCTCSNFPPKIHILGVDKCDDATLMDCYSSCPVNAIASLFLRQAMPILEAEPYHKSMYAKYAN